MFKIFKKLNKVEIISEPERRVDGFYFHVKVPCVVEPLTISTRDLLAKHVSQLSKEDKNIVINNALQNIKRVIFTFDKYQHVTHVITYIFQWLFKYKENVFSKVFNHNIFAN